MKDDITTLVLFYDMSKVNAEFELPDNLKTLDFTEQDLADNMPTLEERSTALAYEAYFFKVQQSHPTITDEEFGNSLDLPTLQKIAQNISPKLDQTITHTSLKEYQRVKALNRTQLDKDRQVK